MYFDLSYLKNICFNSDYFFFQLLFGSFSPNGIKMVLGLTWERARESRSEDLKALSSDVHWKLEHLHASRMNTAYR